MVNLQSGKDLQLESTRKGENIAFTPVMPPTLVASISQRKNVAFILKIRKKYKLQTGATGGDEYFSLKLITTWSCSPSYLQLSAWFFSHNFSSKAHGSL